MSPIKPVAFALALWSSVTGVGAHGDEVTIAIEIRQKHMNTYGAQLRTLGRMVSGETTYDPDAAKEVATTLLELAQADQADFWALGSDIFSTDVATEAMPLLWNDADGFEAKRAALIKAVTTLTGVASDGPSALRGEIGAVGRACTACHERYRLKE